MLISLRASNGSTIQRERHACAGCGCGRLRSERVVKPETMQVREESSLGGQLVCVQPHEPRMRLLKAVRLVRVAVVLGGGGPMDRRFNSESRVTKSHLDRAHVCLGGKPAQCHRLRFNLVVDESPLM